MYADTVQAVHLFSPTEPLPIMLSFLDLATELREMVYELCLVADHTIVPNPTAWERADLRKSRARRREPTSRATSQLAVALLATCKTIHKEASAVLYGRNRFRLPTSPERCRGTIFQRYAALFHHIQICFDCHDLPVEFTANLMIRWFEEHPCCHQISGCYVEHIIQRYHWMRDQETTKLIDIWAKKKLMRMPMTNLVSVILDFTNFRLPTLTHDPQLIPLNENFFTHIMSYWSYPCGFGDPHKLPKVYVIGLESSEDRAIMHGKWGFLSMEDWLNDSTRLHGTQMVWV